LANASFAFKTCVPAFYVHDVELNHV
jgi:hypothetical protein